MKNIEDMTYEELSELETRIRKLKKQNRLYKGGQSIESLDIFDTRLESTELDDFTRKEAHRKFRDSIYAIIDLAIGNYEIMPRKDKFGKTVFHIRRTPLVRDDLTEPYTKMNKELDELIKKYMKGAEK